MRMQYKIWPFLVSVYHTCFLISNKQGSPWPRDLQNVISSSNRSIEYLYKIWFKSFIPFWSYHGNKFLHVTLVWPWPRDLMPIMWKHHPLIIMYYMLKYDGEIHEIVGAKVFHVWPWSDLDLDTSIFKIGRASAFHHTLPTSKVSTSDYM